MSSSDDDYEICPSKRKHVLVSGTGNRNFIQRRGRPEKVPTEQGYFTIY